MLIEVMVRNNKKRRNNMYFHKDIKVKTVQNRVSYHDITNEAKSNCRGKWYKKTE